VTGLPSIDGRQVAAPEKAQFAFWVGSWQVRHEVGDAVDGRNEIGWILDGAVLQERFSAGSDPFAGASFSVPVPGRGWMQTWVDNAGSYLDFAGGWLGDRMVLERTTGLPQLRRQRMTWHSISADRVVWDWAFQDGDGSAWELKWRLVYRRTPP
jgi:hypothetical protein